MLLSALLRHPVLATAGISAVIIALAVILSIVSYQALGQTSPGLTYEVLSALGISTILAPTFLYPWIRTAAKLRRATVEITRLARTDALTGLPNSFVLREHMPHREIAELLRAASLRTASQVDKDWLTTARSAS